MATAPTTNINVPAISEISYVPPIGNQELLDRNLAAVALLDSWEDDGDEIEQRETVQALREALGDRRLGSNRPIFP
jgi:hypothetical protein